MRARSKLIVVELFDRRRIYRSSFFSINSTSYVSFLAADAIVYPSPDVGQMANLASLQFELVTSQGDLHLISSVCICLVLILNSGSLCVEMNGAFLQCAGLSRSCGLRLHFRCRFPLAAQRCGLFCCSFKTPRRTGGKDQNSSAAAPCEFGYTNRSNYFSFENF